MAKTVEEYIAGFDEEVQTKLIKLRKIIKETAPDAQEKISWGVPTYYQNGFLVQFAAYKKHIGFYTSPATIAYFQEELSNYQTNTKNTVQFMMNQVLPIELIRKMIVFKVEENEK